MPRPSNTEERREQITAGLLAVMADVGYERATVVAIARAAGLSPGLLHYHFENKEEILVALVARLAKTLTARVERRLERAGTSPRARLHALLDAWVGLGGDAEPAAVAAWVVVGAEAVRHPAVRRLYGETLAHLFAVLEEAVGAVLRAEGRSPRGARRIAAALLAAIEGSFTIAVAAPGVLPEGFAAPTLRRVADGLVASEPKR